MAESVMQYLSREHNLNWSCDSAGLRSWNLGRRPDKRCLQVLNENGMSTPHFARMVTLRDFMLFDYIFAMDREILKELRYMAAQYTHEDYAAKIIYLGSYMKNCDCSDIKDPFFSSNLNGFRCTYNQIFKSCTNFIEEQKLYEEKLEEVNLEASKLQEQIFKEQKSEEQQLEEEELEEQKLEEQKLEQKLEEQKLDNRDTNATLVQNI